ncbi:TIGR02285 family protein [Neptuniibacter sp.]|uniref:TIGR02285 family protein n=1 Tax=Neptuniibacter sp. TaxID=1962643 RepID=UPI00261C3DEE|nr:TIGR02285 family protein [Neptuniibacter sp.]MCP4597600.1 TIGR02285 family protein [Neptuniibacter sp.]
MRIFQFFFLLVLISAAPASLQAESHSPEVKQNQQIIWGRTDFAPFFIQKGDHSNQGISDNIIRFFSDNITGYQHVSAEMSLKRLLQNAEQGVPICHVVLLKTSEREKFIDYSAPYMFNYANGIVTSEEGLKRIGLSVDNIQPVDLSQLLDKPLRISAHDGRSYSPEIDSIIAENRDQPNSIFQMKSGLKELDRLVKLVAHNRLDGLLARPEEAQFIKTEYGIEAPLYFVKINNSPSISKVHVGCAKGEWNDELFRQIAELVQTREALQVIEASYSQWLPAHLKGHYSKVISTMHAANEP